MIFPRAGLRDKEENCKQAENTRVIIRSAEMRTGAQELTGEPKGSCRILESQAKQGPRGRKQRKLLHFSALKQLMDCGPD